MMGKATWQPKWWKPETHGSAWERVKEALKRDWEQTKSDVHAGGRDLDQDVGDTVKQMAGKEEIPPESQPNSKSLGSDARAWDDVETPMMYGYGARQQYGSQHKDWNDGLERTLRTEWEEGKSTTGRTWDQVKAHVRRGYERARS
jgi:hypothetical protein